MSSNPLSKDSKEYTGVYSQYESLATKRHRTETSKPSLRQSSKDSELNDYNTAGIRILPLSTEKPIDKFLLDENNKTHEYIGFMLATASEAFSEKVEVVQLPGDSYASFFYGSTPPQFSYAGVVLNTEQDKWKDSFEILYRDYTRGTKAARSNSIVQIKYDRKIVSGYVVSLTLQTEGSSDTHSMFTMTMLVKSITYLDLANTTKQQLLSKYSKKIDAKDALTESGYTILDLKDLDALRSRVTTGFIVPPPRPPSQGKKLPASITSPNCFVTSLTMDDGELNKDKQLNSSSLSGAVNCNIVDVASTLVSRTSEINSKINDLSGKQNLTEKERAELRALTEAQAKLLEQKSSILNKSDTSQKKAAEQSLKSVRDNMQDVSGDAKVKIGNNEKQLKDITVEDTFKIAEDQHKVSNPDTDGSYEKNLKNAEDKLKQADEAAIDKANKKSAERAKQQIFRTQKSDPAVTANP